jgi:hypothetical protein
MTPAKVFPIAMALIFGGGAAMFFWLGLEWHDPRQYLFAIIMALGMFGHLGLLAAAIKMNR